MLKKRIASILLASVMAVGGASVTAFAEEPVTTDDAFQAAGKKAAAYRQMTDEERAELRAQIFASLTDEQKAAIIEEIGGGKGGAQGTNAQGNKGAAFENLTEEERAELRAQVFASLTDEQKAAIIEKMGGGKGGGSGVNHNRATEDTAQ